MKLEFYFGFLSGMLTGALREKQKGRNYQLQLRLICKADAGVNREVLELKQYGKAGRYPGHVLRPPKIPH